MIRFYSVSDDTGKTTYYKPDQVTSSGKNTPMTLDMAFSYQDPDTDIHSRAVKGLRLNTDTVGGNTSITPTGWFLENEGEYMSLVMVLGSNRAWNMNYYDEFSYCKWYSDDDTVSEYNNEKFHGYKGLDI